jgi:Zn-dependent protease
VKILLVLLTGAKLGKFALTASTMLLSMFTYSLVFGWPYAVGFVALLLCHEMGHYLAGRQRGLNVGAPTFIPFVGAWINLKDQPRDAETEAYIAIAGPMLGTAAAFLCYLVAEGRQGLMLALAYAGFMLNLFNLVPVTPLDGGRILGIVSPKIWGVGLGLLVGLFFVQPNPLILLIALLGVPQVWTAWRGTGRMPPAYYDVPVVARAKYFCEYLLLTGFLAVMTTQLHATLSRH